MTKPDAVKAGNKLVGKGFLTIGKIGDSDFSYVIVISIFNGFYWMPKVFYHYEQVTRFLEE